MYWISFIVFKKCLLFFFNDLLHLVGVGFGKETKEKSVFAGEYFHRHINTIWRLLDWRNMSANNPACVYHNEGARCGI